MSLHNIKQALHKFYLKSLTTLLRIAPCSQLRNQAVSTMYQEHSYQPGIGRPRHKVVTTPDPEENEYSLRKLREKAMYDPEGRGRCLDLSREDLARLPPALYSIDDLQTLDVSENPINSLPDEIVKLSKLRKFSCLHCGLTVLPDFLGTLASLEELRMSVNAIIKFPPSDTFSKMKHLKVLELTMCSLEEIPSCIFVLTSLREIDLQCNKLRHIQQEITNLKRLKTLNLADNNFRIFSEALCSMENLTSLNMSRNKIRALPQKMSELTRLRNLRMSQNKITCLPQGLFALENLKLLHLDSNRISNLSPQICLLKKLALERDNFTIHDNPLKSPPIHVCLKGFDQIIKFFTDDTGEPARQVSQ